MDSGFYSFTDAFQKASCRQKKDYTDDDHKKAALDQVRRQFRSFLDALSIEYTSLKSPEHLSNFRDAKNSKVDDVAAEYIAHCKTVTYSFNSDGFNLAVDFICNWTEPEYKAMRRRNFCIEGKKKYQKIISAVKSNMAALGYTEEIIFQQECMFWHNIASHSSYDVLDFLDISTLLGRRGKLQEISKSSSASEVDDLIYVNNLVCQDYVKFQKKWLIRIEKALQYRRDFASKSLDDPDLDEFIKLISTNLCSDSHDNDPISRLDLRSQKKIDDAEVECFHKTMNLIYTVANCGSIPEFEAPIGSKELYDRIIEEELQENRESLKADDKLPHNE